MSTQYSPWWNNRWYSTGLNSMVVLFTGGAGGMGQEVVPALRVQGMQVIITSRTAEKATQVANKLNRIPNIDGPEVLGLELDAGSESSASSLAKEILRRFGRLNCLIVGAGGNDSSEFVAPGTDPFSVSTEATWNVVDKNLRTAIITCNTFCPLLLKNDCSSTILIGSEAGVKPLPGIPGYSMGKAGLANYAQHLGVAVPYFTGNSAHRVNWIEFGFAVTEQNRTKLEYPDGSPTPRAVGISSMYPTGKIDGSLDDLIGPMLFLLSPTMGKGMNASEMRVDLGFSRTSVPRYW